jgi:hypothetical protein
VRLVTTAILGFEFAGGGTFFGFGGGSTLVQATGLVAAADGCHGSYRGACLPPDALDVDCVGQEGNGPLFVTGPFRAVGNDDYHRDPDRDGIACESPFPQGKPGVVSYNDVALGPPGD